LAALGGDAKKRTLPRESFQQPALQVPADADKRYEGLRRVEAVVARLSLVFSLNTVEIEVRGVLTAG